jgi:hypothetical protein
MKLLQFKHRKDWGQEFYSQFLITQRWTLLQVSVSWYDDASGPYFSLTMGSNGLFSVMFWIYKFGFDIGFIERTWNWDEIDV